MTKLIGIVDRYQHLEQYLIGYKIMKDIKCVFCTFGATSSFHHLHKKNAGLSDFCQFDLMLIPSRLYVS